MLLAVPVAAALALGSPSFVSQRTNRHRKPDLPIVLGCSSRAQLLPQSCNAGRSALQKPIASLSPSLYRRASCFWRLGNNHFGLRLFPLPYFPGPAGVLQSLMNDRGLLFDSTWHSLVLLLSGYAARRHRWLRHRRLHRLVRHRALLGHAFAQSGRTNSGDRLDSARHGHFALGHVFRRRLSLRSPFGFRSRC